MRIRPLFAATTYRWINYVFNSLISWIDLWGEDWICQRLWLYSVTVDWVDSIIMVQLPLIKVNLREAKLHKIHFAEINQVWSLNIKSMHKRKSCNKQLPNDRVYPLWSHWLGGQYKGSISWEMIARYHSWNSFTFQATVFAIKTTNFIIW